MNLLIVDDEILTIKGIEKGIHWELLPFDHIYTATSVPEAKEYLTAYRIDILLCDIGMPLEGGLDLLAWIREKAYKTECIFLTCHNEFRYAQEAVKLQGMDYLLKPVPYEELQEILSRAAVKVEQKNENSRYQEYGRMHVERLRVEAAELSEDRNQTIVDSVKKYIQAHLQEELSVELLADKAYVSTTHLHRIFKKEEKMTLVEYITKTRMFYASQMLKEKKLPITKVAITVGYSNYCYFTKVFKKEFGLSPRDYQKKYSGQPGEKEKE